jgi:hypothetical protein
MSTAFGEILKFARRLRLRVASIFHDAIPILRPDLCNEEMRLNHRGYIRYLAQTDVVMPNSNFSAQSLRDIWVEDRIPPTRIATNVLPAEFSGAERNPEAPARLAAKTVSILCVSTLEPRKNHLKLIEACLRMGAGHPELDWNLTLVGNKYAGALDLADTIQQIARENPRIQWLGIVDDEKLCRLYSEATFTVYPSIIEGFGMPILESVWHARPCLCFDQGVMAEIAAEGGCLTADVTDAAAFADALSRLATDAGLRADLSVQATRRKLKTWTEYASQLLDTLVQAGTPAHLNGNGNLENLLYPVCLTEKWQMQDSERVGLTGLLERLRPACSIEIGTFHGGSLSLITQYSKAVFSIDIDATVPSRMPAFANPNVRYLIGRSQEILPTLLAELDEAGLFPEFVLVDGDHSAEGVRRDFEMLLDYVPKRPLVVLAHDSFNPGCRSGMLAVDWQRSPHVHEVDLDFVPGRITNLIGGQRDLWGGFALAYLNPRVREGPLHIRRSADLLFDACTKYLQSC